MGIVYSTSFFQLAGISGSVTFTVPAGFQCVVRDASAYHGSAASPANLYLEGANGQTFWHWSTGFAFSGGSNQWRGHMVTPPGSGLTVRTDDPFDVTVSGYLLALP